jgi:hypothetical protein
MSGRQEDTGLGAASVLDADEVSGVLSGAFYVPGEGEPHARTRKAASVPKPAHYRVICISLYTKDLDALDARVDELKARGMTKANRSALIRIALEQLDIDKVPRGL